MARILVIEDSPENLELMSYLLEAFGHVAIRAADGEQGVEIAGREIPDLIICDIHLPQMDGYAVARQLKRNPMHSSIPLVAVTALAMVGDRDKVLAAGFDGYIAKPIVPKRFVAQVESYLRPPADHGPTRPPPAQAPTPPPPAPTQMAATIWHGEHAKVLAVDDSPPNRELLRQTLEPVGYEARVVATVAEALASARQWLPDLILSDLHMPHKDGFDFIRAAKADSRLAAVPFIIITSSLWVDHDRATAQRLGATRFLTRPIAPAVLLDEIAACLPPSKGIADGADPDR